MPKPPLPMKRPKVMSLRLMTGDLNDFLESEELLASLGFFEIGVDSLEEIPQDSEAPATVFVSGVAEVIVMVVPSSSTGEQA